MKNLNIYLRESLLDDFDNLEKSTDNAIYEPQLKEMMSFLMPSYAGNFRTDWDLYYHKKSHKLFIDASIQSLYIIKYKNKIYALPIDNVFKSRHGDELNEKMEEFISLMEATKIIFKFNDFFSKVYIDESLKGENGKISNKVEFEQKSSIGGLYIPFFAQEWLDIINKFFNKKIEKVHNLHYKDGVVDLKKDFDEIKFPFGVGQMNLKLPISINNKLKPWKTGRGLIGNDEAHELIWGFMMKHEIFKINVHKPGSAFIDGELMCSRRSMWFNKW